VLKKSQGSIGPTSTLIMQPGNGDMLAAGCSPEEFVIAIEAFKPAFTNTGFHFSPLYHLD
jgi:hypothetical protein